MVDLGYFLEMVESPASGVGAGVLFVVEIERRTPERIIPQLVSEAEKEELAVEGMPVVGKKNAAVILHDI